ncbi:three-Cys-motif partner protein TcmP [Paraflavisolibacter sp. H34]|uniref:three-Cys-motif partner protein TcmP n=1 Tax=Huijunlia imazamoxiresistens TaxID=3127457 RepID=UPI003017577E
MQARFFDQQRSGSKVKSSLLVPYFAHWARIVLPVAVKAGGTFCYADFSSGPGRHEDGTDASPLQVLQLAAQAFPLGEHFTGLFSDREQKNRIRLKKELAALSIGEGGLPHAPRVEPMATAEEVLAQLEALVQTPALVALEPWGYKGLRLDTLAARLFESGPDCLFSFQPAPVLAAVVNPFQAKNVDAFFGKEEADKLRAGAELLNTAQREELALNTFLRCLKQAKRYHFLIYQQGADANGHAGRFFVFATRNLQRYHFMETIMQGCGRPAAPEPSSRPARAGKRARPVQPTLFDRQRRRQRPESALFAPAFV